MRNFFASIALIERFRILFLCFPTFWSWSQPHMNNANKGRWICRPIGKWTLKLVLVWYLIDKLIIEDLLVNLMRTKSWGRCLKLLYAHEIWFSNWSAWISKISALVCGLLFRVDSQNIYRNKKSAQSVAGLRSTQKPTLLSLATDPHRVTKVQFTSRSSVRERRNALGAPLIIQNILFCVIGGS